MHERVLIVDDDQAVRSSLRRFLQRNGFEVAEADSCQSAEERFRTFSPMVALIDYRLPDGEAITLLPKLRHIDPACTLFVLTGHGTIDLAVRAVKLGATEFLTKPIDMTVLLRAVQIGVRASRAGLARSALVEPLFGSSSPMKRLEAQVAALATSEDAVLLSGEDGTGRSTLARWLHAIGPRAGASFVEQVCGAESAERDLFGFERADDASRPGVLEAAEGGTLFLHDLQAAPLSLQSRLLALLRTGRFLRAGSNAARLANVRLFASTDADLVELAAAGEFDAELAAWFESRILRVPPLRERADDVVTLARHILTRLSTRHSRPLMSLSPDAEDELRRHPWPGNVRELENVLEIAILLGAGAQIEVADLPIDRRASSERVTLEEVERRTISEALRDENGRVEAAAKRLGIPRSTLYYKLKIMGLTPQASPSSKTPARRAGGKT